MYSAGIILSVSVYLVLTSSSALARPVQHYDVVTHSVPHATCWNTGCDGKYPAGQGCETSSSQDLQRDNVYDRYGVFVGVQHQYYDGSCSGYHFGLDVTGAYCVTSVLTAEGVYNTQDQAGNGSPSAVCPGHWIDSVMDEYDPYTKCSAAWVSGFGQSQFQHKLIHGGAGC